MSTERAGWSVGFSIALELDVVLGMLTDTRAASLPELPEEALDLLRRIPAEWRDASRELLGRTGRWPSLMGSLASLAGVLLEADYSKATLAMRALTLSEALERAAAMAMPLGVMPAGGLPPAERLADLMARMGLAVMRSLGFDLASWGVLPATVRRDVLHATRLLRDGDLHTRFWHWLDRGYYECYRPWRDSRAELMQQEAERAASALGGRAGETPPPLGWLPRQNVLNVFSHVGEAVRAGRVRVHFWVQPFGLFDYWTIAAPGLLVVSFAEPGSLFAGFRSEAEAVAARARAIADPTRLMILRIIRHFGMDNTQIADYLGIARPTVSVHAKVLREAGLIETTHEGRQARHRIRAAEVRRLFHDLIRFLDLPEEEEREANGASFDRSGPA